MKKLRDSAYFSSIRIHAAFLRLKQDKRGEMALNQILGIAVALIIAAFVTIPALRTFANTVLTALDTWYDSTVATRIFPAS
jgi:hypothetical protein